MARKKKTQLNLTSESVKEFMQEIYTECDKVKKQALNDIAERKVAVELDDTTDVYQVGKVNNESLKIIDNTIDKKIQLLKLQSQIVFKDESNKTEDAKITSDDKSAIIEAIRAGREKQQGN